MTDRRRRPSPELPASTPDAVLGMREGNLPIVVREYARNLHTQVHDIYARLGVTSFADVAALPRENLLAHAEDVAKLQMLLPRLREALAHPDIAKSRIRDAADCVWYAKTAMDLERRAREAAMVWGDDNDARAESVLGDIHLRLIDARDDEEREEMVQRLDAEFDAQPGMLQRGNLLSGAAEMGFVQWAEARSVGDTANFDIRGGLVRGHAVNGNIHEAWRIFCAMAGSDPSNRSQRYSEYGVDLLVAAAKAGAEDVMLDIERGAPFTEQLDDLREQAFYVLLEEGNFDAAELLVTQEHGMVSTTVLEAQRYIRGEDVTEEYTRQFENALTRRACDEACHAAQRLPRDGAKRAYVDIVAVFKNIPEDDTSRRIEAAIALAWLAHEVSEDVAPWIDFLEEVCEDLRREEYDIQMQEYVPLLVRVGEKAKALERVATVHAAYSRVWARLGIIAELLRRGDMADVAAQVRVALDDAVRNDKRSTHDVEEDNMFAQIAKEAIAVRDATLVAGAWAHMRLGAKVRYAAPLARALTEQEMPVDDQLQSLVVGSDPESPKTWEDYVVLAASLGGGREFIEGYDTFDFRRLRTTKSQITFWLWKGAYAAKRKAQLLAQVTGV